VNPSFGGTIKGHYGSSCLDFSDEIHPFHDKSANVSNLE